jgi:PGF-CTERM protein
MKDSRFKKHKIEVEFYSEEDFGGDPTYINPEDAIVSVQGAGSSGGPCFTMPTGPGWYQVNGMIRGTTHDGEGVEIESKSHYFPICEGCHDEATAREKLGRPPSQRDDGSDDEETTPTPTATATPTPTESDETDETPTPTETATPTPTDDGGEAGEEDDDDGATGADDSDSTGGDDELTPTPGDGPGFTGFAALLALLAAALLAHRR